MRGVRGTDPAARAEKAPVELCAVALDAGGKPVAVVALEFLGAALREPRRTVGLGELNGDELAAGISELGEVIGEHHSGPVVVGRLPYLLVERLEQRVR